MKPAFVAPGQVWHWTDDSLAGGMARYVLVLSHRSEPGEPLVWVVTVNDRNDIFVQGWRAMALMKHPHWECINA